MTSHPSSSSHRRRKRLSDRSLAEKARVQAMGVPVEYSAETNPHKTNRGLLRAWHALHNSWSGLVFAVREESAFRQELLVAACLVPMAVILPFGAIERMLLIASVVFVLVVELLNSSIEAAVDRISFEHHGLSKRAKDYGSAAVMLACLMCACIWITLLVRLLARG